MAGRDAAVTRAQAQTAFARMLLERVREDNYPSWTHMQILEQSLPRSLYGDYLNILLEKVARDTNPSISMLRRIAEIIARL
jgi:hypothetical protein